MLSGAGRSVGPERQGKDKREGRDEQAFSISSTERFLQLGMPKRDLLSIMTMTKQKKTRTHID